MNVEEKINLVKEVGEEILTEEDLRALFEKKKNPVAYDGFEPSGSMHIAQGLLRAINVNKMIKAGCRFKMWVADWHAWANNKLDGDLEKIQACGKYFIEVWKASGMDLDKVEFVWANEAMKDVNYWKTVMNVARNSTLQRIVRCGQIMGRSEKDVLQASQIFYPCMQAADIFYLNVDICQLGMDQRKVNVLAREVGEKLGFWKPVAVHHHMLMGLDVPVGDIKEEERKIAFKMSKSRPESAIFMTDSEEEIKNKLRKAYCPEKQVKDNPVIDYYKHIIFEKFEKINIERDKKFGGDLEIGGYGGLADIYASGKLHPLDLKNAAAFHINKLVDPVRRHFEKGKAKELLERVKSFRVTR